MYRTNDGKVEDDISKTVRELIRNNDLEILHSTLTDISDDGYEQCLCPASSVCVLCLAVC